MTAKKPAPERIAADPTLITDSAVAVQTAAAHPLPNGGGSYVLIDGVLVKDNPDADAADAAVKEA